MELARIGLRVQNFTLTHAFINKQKLTLAAKVYIKPCQASNMERFARIVNV